MKGISRPFAFVRIYLSLLVCLDLIFIFDTQRSQHFAIAFNIDEEYPIVISNKFNGKDAHFGASVLLMPSATTGRGHYGNDDNGIDDRSSNITGWIIIGAPKANSTASVKYLNIFEPGMLWRCSLGGYQSTGDNVPRYCEIMNIDPTGEYDPFDRNMPFKDKKDGGWLGGSMFVGDSERFVACASRWINQKYKNAFLQNGICYWLPKSELVRESDGSNWPSLPPKLSYRLSPLLNKTKQYHALTSSKLIAQLDRDMLYDWAYGQFGFATHVTPDNEFISGSPGVFDWAGSVVYYRDTLGPQPLLRRYNAHAGSPAFSEVLVVPSQTLDPVISSNDYLGYAVTSGKFFTPAVSKNKTQFAAGAPRSSHLSGKVVVFTLKEVKGNRSVGKMEFLGEPLEGHDASNGNHYASYFGSTLLALDVNGDGFDDLLVGAPLFGAFHRYKRNAATSTATTPTERGGGGEDNKKENSTEESPPQAKVKSGDEGCVFVYLSTGEEFALTPQQLFGDKISGARFGMTLTSLSDINYDGFNDVAIGAPYENEGRGAVYIYHGGKYLMTLVQKLKPELIDPKIRTFGGSLSLGVDVDANGYPDLAVGAYETNQVFIYRTIPIIHFTSTLTATIPKLHLTTEEFNLTSCISYAGHGTTMPTGLAIWLNLTVEVDPIDGKKESLIALIDDIADGGARLPSRNRTDNRVLLLSYERRLYVRGDGSGSCYNFSAVKVGSLDIVSRSISIRQYYRLDGYQGNNGIPKPMHYHIYPGGLSPETNLPFPAVNLSQSKSKFQEFFNAKLLMPDGKMSGTNHLLLPVGTICEADGDSECLANLTIAAWLHDLNTGEIYDSNHPFTLGTTDILSLHVELTNHRETANLPITIKLKRKPSLVVRRLPTNCEYTASKSLICSLSRAIKENQTVAVVIEFEMFGLYGRAPEVKNIIDISFEANTSSALVQSATQKFRVPLATSMKPQNYSHEGSKIEYSVGNVSIPIFGFTQGFEVGLIGPSSAAELLVTFDIPVGLYLPSDDNSGREEYHWLIGVRKPIVTYDGKMKCKTVNGSFLEEKDILNELNSYELPSVKINEDEEGVNDIGNLDDDYSVPMVSEATKILQGKIRRVRRSLQASLSEESRGRDDYEYGGIEKVTCGPSSSSKSTYEAKCLRVVCTASHFTPSKKAVIEFKLRIFNKVAGKLLDLLNAGEHYENGVSSLWIESFGVVRTLSVDGKPFGESGFIQFTSRLKIPPPYDLPAWIVIVSVGGGLLMFTLVAWMLKRCGFFRRSTRDELIRRRVAELERSQLKSTPVNSPSTSSTARMRTNSKSCLKDRYNDHKGIDQDDIPRFSRNGSVAGLQVGTPTSPVRQREMPGAVDLNELRRLYECENDNQFY